VIGERAEDASRERLVRAEILDPSFPVKGATAWYPHGFDLARRMVDEAAAVLEQEGYAPTLLPALVPLELFHTQAAAIKDFTPKLYTADIAGDERFVLAPTMEAQVSALFRQWLAGGATLPLRIYTVRQIARHEIGRLVPLWRQRLIWPSVESQSAFVGDPLPEMRAPVRATRAFTGRMGVPVLCIRRRMSGATFADYALDRWEIVTILPSGRVNSFSSVYRLGDRFSRAFGVVDGQGRCPEMVNFGFTSRLLWAMLSLLRRGEWPVYPHTIAPLQAAAIPVAADDPEQLGHARRIAAELARIGVRAAVLGDPTRPHEYGRSCERARRLGVPVQLHVGRAEVAADSATLRLAWRAEPVRMLGRAACAAQVPALLDACTRELFEENRRRLAGQVAEVGHGDGLPAALIASPTSAVSLCDDPGCEQRVDAVLAELDADPVGYLVEPPGPARRCWCCGRASARRLLCGQKVKGEK
jgi:prolyl-tRNA synthetase